MIVPDPPEISTNFFTPRDAAPASAVTSEGMGVRSFYGIRKYDVRGGLKYLDRKRS